MDPENVIVFYRNEFQSASTIKISKNAALKEPLKFQLKTTNKAAYLVSESSGELSSGHLTRYINILINEQFPLEQCLHDRFKLLIFIPGLPPIEKKFKVIMYAFCDAVTTRRMLSRPVARSCNGWKWAPRLREMLLPILPSWGSLSLLSRKACSRSHNS